MTIYKGQNIIGVPGLTEEDFADCALEYLSSGGSSCLYNKNGHFVYYNPNGKNGGDCGKNFFSTNTMEQGVAYYLYAGTQCEVTFDQPGQVEVTLYPNVQNIISVPVETSLADVALVGGDEAKIFTNFRSGTKAGCEYNKNGYFVYYDTGSASGTDGDCGSKFKSESKMRPFVGYFVFSNGKDGDKTTQFKLSYPAT